MIIRRMLALTGMGMGLGLAGALAVTRVMAGLLYEVRPTDATVFLGTAFVLALLALVASLAPVWHPTRVDPLIVLRTD